MKRAPGDEFGGAGIDHPNGEFPVPTRVTLREFVYTELYDRILTGALESGARLNEVQIARQMGISRGPVREALRQLEQDGLVESSAGKGAFVTQLSREDVEDCYSLRIVLETLAVRLTIERSTAEELKELDEHVERIRKLDHKSKDMAHYTTSFHGEICKLSKNRALLRAWETITGQIQALAIPVLSSIYRNSAEVADKHQVVVDAMRSGDVDLAQKAMVSHISLASAKVLESIGERERQSDDE